MRLMCRGRRRLGKVPGGVGDRVSERDQGQSVGGQVTPSGVFGDHGCQVSDAA